MRKMEMDTLCRSNASIDAEVLVLKVADAFIGVVRES